MALPKVRCRSGVTCPQRGTEGCRGVHSFTDRNREVNHHTKGVGEVCRQRYPQKSDAKVGLPADREVHGVAGHNGEGGHLVSSPSLHQGIAAELVHNWPPNLLASLHHHHRDHEANASQA